MISVGGSLAVDGLWMGRGWAVIGVLTNHQEGLRQFKMHPMLLLRRQIDELCIKVQGCDANEAKSGNCRRVKKD